jgi:hypothetical protein
MHLASEGVNNKMKLSSFCLCFVLLNELRFTCLNQYKFRFEEFDLMEYSLQKSFHTITLKDGFFLTSPLTRQLQVLFEWEVVMVKLQIRLLSLRSLGHSLYITVGYNFKNIKILKVLRYYTQKN